MPELFRVTSRINGINYDGKRYDNVIFNWFVIDRSGLQIPGEEAIINYADLPENNRKNAELYIQELFTREEVAALKTFLGNLTGGTVNIENVNLPVADNIRGYASLSPGKGIGFTDLFKRKGYNLDFRVRGFFNINDAQESFQADERPTVIAKIDPELFKRGND